MASTYGGSKDKYFYEPADADLPTENVWNTSKYLRVVPELFKAAREALGWDVHLLHDIHHRLTPIEAGRRGRDLEPYRRSEERRVGKECVCQFRYRCSRYN